MNKQLGFKMRYKQPIAFQCINSYFRVPFGVTYVSYIYMVLLLLKKNKKTTNKKTKKTG